MKRFIFLLSLLTCHYIVVFVFTKTVHTLLDVYMIALKFGMAKCSQCILCSLKDFFDNNTFVLNARNTLRRYKSRVSESYLMTLCVLIKNQMLLPIYSMIFESIPEETKCQQHQTNHAVMPFGRVILARNIAWTITVMTHIRIGAHMLIESGFELVKLGLKRATELKRTYQPFVNPLALISTNSTHGRIVTYALKCVSSLIKKQMSFKRFDATISSILANIFIQPMHRVFQSIIHILRFDQKRICEY